MSRLEVPTRHRVALVAVAVLGLCLGALVSCANGQSMEVDLSKTVGLDLTCTTSREGDTRRWSDGVDAVVYVNQDGSAGQIIRRTEDGFTDASPAKGDAAAIRSQLEASASVERVIETSREDYYRGFLEAFESEEIRASISIDDLPTELRVVASSADAELPFRFLMQIIEARAGVLTLIERVDLCLPDTLEQTLRCQTTTGEDLMVMVFIDDHPLTDSVEKSINAEPSVDSVRFVDSEASLLEVSELLGVDPETTTLISGDAPASFRIRTSDPDLTASALRQAVDANGNTSIVQAIVEPGSDC